MLLNFKIGILQCCVSAWVSAWVKRWFTWIKNGAINLTLKQLISNKII